MRDGSRRRMGDRPGLAVQGEWGLRSPSAARAGRASSRAAGGRRQRGQTRPAVRQSRLRRAEHGWRPRGERVRRPGRGDRTGPRQPGHLDGPVRQQRAGRPADQRHRRRRDAFREELELCRQLSALPIASEGLLGLAAVAVVDGDLSQAARLRGAAAAHDYGQHHDDVEARLEAVFFAGARTRHGADAWDTAFREGGSAELRGRDRLRPRRAERLAFITPIAHREPESSTARTPA
jgi:hypothetical protein